MLQGALLVIDGVDGSGKNTVCRLVAEKLKEIGDAVVVLPFPSREGAIGSLIRKKIVDEPNLFSDRALLHLFAADALDYQARIDDHLKNGVCVICDRHPIITSLAYQVGETCSLVEWIQVTLSFFAASFQKSFLFVLDCQPGVARERMELSREKLSSFDSRGVEFFSRVRIRYMSPEVGLTPLGLPENYIMIDTTHRSAQAVAQIIFGEVTQGVHDAK